MQLTLTLNPDSRDDIKAAKRLIDRLERPTLTVEPITQADLVKVASSEAMPEQMTIPEVVTAPWDEPVTEPDPVAETKPNVTKDDLFAVALKLSKAGKQKALAEVFAKFGAKKLSGIDPKDYEACLKELNSLGG